MYKKFLTALILTAAAVCTAHTVFAVPANEGRIVKVGISDSGFKDYYFNNISVSATDNFRLTDKKTNSVIADFGAGENVKVIIKNNLFDIYMDETQIAANISGPVEVSSENGYVTVTNLKRAGKPAYYRGTFEITKVPKKNNQFNLINILDLQSYLRGVVPNEMPVRFGEEALRAQAVLARNYVLKPREKNYHNFDVCDSVACQVYYGANTEKDLSDEAVAATENIVAMHNGEMVLALYSSTAGGYTENYENAFSTDFGSGNKMFPGMPKPYLKGVPDNPRTPVLSNENEFKRFYLTKPETFDNDSPYFRWTKEWSLAELEGVLKKTLKTQSATGFVRPKLDNPDNFGHIKEIKVLRRGVSGKAMSVNIVTDKGTYNVQKELQIRRVFQKNNIGLPSANVIFEIKDNPENESEKIVTAYGGGFGHGVGMSQYGAGAMAKKDYTYDEIIQHYFTDTAITTYPVTLVAQNGQDTALQNFYTNRKKAFLVVDNRFHFTKLTVAINGQEVNFDINPNIFKPERIDISSYIRKGENKITYILPYTNTHKKPVTMYVEIKEAKNDR